MTRDFYINLGKRIYALRKATGITREKFAENAGINDYYLGEIERGEKRASIEILLKICHVLDLEIHELLKLK